MTQAIRRAERPPGRQINPIKRKLERWESREQTGPENVIILGLTPSIQLDLRPLFLEPGDGQCQRGGIGSEHGFGMAGVQRNGAARVEVIEA